MCVCVRVCVQYYKKKVVLCNRLCIALYGEKEWGRGVIRVCSSLLILPAFVAGRVLPKAFDDVITLYSIP